MSVKPSGWNWCLYKKRKTAEFCHSPCMHPGETKKKLREKAFTRTWQSRRRRPAPFPSPTSCPWAEEHSSLPSTHLPFLFYLPLILENKREKSLVYHRTFPSPPTSHPLKEVGRILPTTHLPLLFLPNSYPLKEVRRRLHSTHIPSYLPLILGKNWGKFSPLPLSFPFFFCLRRSLSSTFFFSYLLLILGEKWGDASIEPTFIPYLPVVLENKWRDVSPSPYLLSSLGRTAEEATPFCSVSYLSVLGLLSLKRGSLYVIHLPHSRPVFLSLF